MASIISIPILEKDYQQPINFHPIARLSPGQMYNSEKTPCYSAHKMRAKHYRFRPGQSIILQLTKLIDDISLNFS